MVFNGLPGGGACGFGPLNRFLEAPPRCVLKQLLQFPRMPELHTILLVGVLFKITMQLGGQFLPNLDSFRSLQRPASTPTPTTGSHAAHAHR